MRKWLTTLPLVLVLSAFAQESGPRYVCPPCNSDCDDLVFDAPGSCTSCNMDLINADNPSEGLAYTHLQPNEVCDRVASNKDIVLLDVRSVEEFAGETSELGRLKNAINIPIQELGQRIGELEAYQESEIIVYCSMSVRSPRGSALLAENGFSNVNNMLGGLNYWNQLKKSELKCKNQLLEK